MKIVSLNTWGGRAGKESLLSFFKAHANVDVFCLQEIWSAAHEDPEWKNAGGRPLRYEEIMATGVKDIGAVLPDHIAFFRPHLKENFGLLMLVKKNLKVLEDGEVFVHKHKGFIPEGDVGNHARNVQYVTIQSASGPISVLNLHGLWTGQGKGDTPERLEQSRKIIELLKKFNHPVILCGDFNLLPDTESVRMVESAGLRNLVKEFSITSTRTSFYKKPEKFADYAFVSRSFDVTRFEVLPDEVSDHAPLLVEIV